MTNDSLVRGALPLTTADLALWRARPARLVLPAIGWLCIVTVCLRDIVAEFSSPESPFPAAVVEEPSYVLSGLMIGSALSLLAVLGVAPRAGLWLAALWAGLFTKAAWPATVPWCVAATAVLVVSALLASAALGRQSSASRAWSARASRALPQGDRVVLQDLLRRWPARAVVGVVLLVVALAGAGLYVHDDVAARAFRASSSVVAGTVVAVEEDSVLVEVGTGDESLEIDVPTPFVERSVGDQVEVRHSGGRSELVDDVFDPTGPLLITGIGLPLGGVLLVTSRRRRRRLRSLLEEGGPAVRMLATWSDDAVGVLLTAVDDDVPAVLASDIAGLWMIDDEPDLDDPERRWFDDASARPVEELSDSDLLRLAAASADDREPDVAASPDLPDGPDHWHRTPVVVVGLARDGAPLSLQGPDGAWYVALAGPPYALPHRQAPGLPAAVAPVAGAGADVDADVDESGKPSDGFSVTASRFRRLLQATGTIGPWLAIPLPALAGAWIALDVESYMLVGLAAGAAWAGGTWIEVGRPCLSIGPRSLVVWGTLLHEVVPWSRVESAVADERSVVVRVSATSTATAEAHCFTQRDPGLPLARGASTPAEVCAAVLRARDTAILRGYNTAMPGRGHEIRRRPSRAAVVGAAWAVALLLGAAFGLQG